jgi:hypothetical protein
MYIYKKLSAFHLHQASEVPWYEIWGSHGSEYVHGDVVFDMMWTTYKSTWYHNPEDYHKQVP